jgi:hypothetical protein
MAIEIRDPCLTSTVDVECEGIQGFVYTNYPCQIDGSNELPIAVDLQTPVKAEVVNRHREALIAIESELGIQPSGTYTTVRARLDALDSLLCALFRQLEDIEQGLSISVQQDGSTIVDTTKIINFTGPGVEVTQSSDTQADVFINGGLVLIQIQQTLPVNTIGQTSFELTFEPSDNTAIEMFVNGVKQQHGVDYTASGKIVTYSGSRTLQTADIVEFWYLAEGSTVQVIQESETVSVNGDTTFVLSERPQDATAVKMYVNGIKQEHGVDYVVAAQTLEYTATRLLEVGDIVEFWYIVGLAGSSEAQTISVLDEGIPIDSAAQILNFVGPGVRAESKPGNQVDIFIFGDGYAPVQERLTVASVGQTLFALSQNPIDYSVVMLFVNGVKQIYGTDYTVNGNAVTYTSSTILLPEDKVEAYYFVTSRDGYVPVMQSVTISIDSQTIFTLQRVPDPTTVMFFINGIKQVFGSDYTVSGSEITYTGSIPLIVTDELESFYFIEGASGIDGYGGGGTPLQIKDEGILIDANVNCINFIGTDVFAESTTAGEVNVYIPPNLFLSHWNTSDGTNGDQSVAETLSRSTTRISTPNGGEGIPFNTNGWAATNQSTTISTTPVFTTPGDTTGFGGDSTITVNVYDADGVSILETFTTASLTANGVYSSGSGNISVTITNYGTDTIRFKANASVSVNAGQVLSDNGLSGGRYHVEVIHTTDSTTDGTGPYSYIGTDVFLDNNPTTPSITGTVSISETVGNVLTKHISGIEYYILGSDFTVDVTDIDQLNRNTIRTSQNLQIEGSDYGLSTLEHSPFGLGSSNFSNWTNNNNVDGVDYQITDWEITSSNFRFVGNTANTSSTPRDPWGSGSSVNSSNASILVDTYGTTSSALSEFFDDEARREDGYFTSSWDSTVSLSSGDAIVFNGQLMAPDQTTFVGESSASNANWTTFKPDLGGSNPDYTSLGVPVNYYRTFNGSVGSTTGFTMTFSGTFNGADALTDLVNEDLQVFVYKIAGLGNVGPPPGNTTPLLLHGSAYNFATFDDGVTDGYIRISASPNNNTINATFGGFSASNGIYCHIRINNSNIKLSSVAITYN